MFRGRECSGQTVQLQRTTSRARSARLGLGAAASKTTQLLLAANGSSVCPPFVFSLLPSCCTHALAHDLQRLRPRPSWEAKTGLIGGTGTGRAAGRFRWSLDSDCNAARGTAVSRSVPRTRRNQSAAATPPAGAARRPSGHALGATPAVAGLQHWPPWSGHRSRSRRIAHCYWSAPGPCSMNALACSRDMDG